VTSVGEPGAPPPPLLLVLWPPPQAVNKPIEQKIKTRGLLAMYTKALLLLLLGCPPTERGLPASFPILAPESGAIVSP
jgi:hypothetical protein